MCNLIQISINVASVLQLALIGANITNIQNYLIGICIGLILLQYIILHKFFFITLITVISLTSYILALYSAIIKSPHYIIIIIIVNSTMTLLNLVVISVIDNIDLKQQLNNIRRTNNTNPFRDNTVISVDEYIPLLDD